MITAYRTAFGDPKAAMGRQAEPFEGATLWIVPNPSGLNAHETVESLASAYREPALATGVVADGPTEDGPTEDGAARRPSANRRDR